MAEGIKIKPDQPKRYYLGVDVTGALDTVAWGQMWAQTFGWSNLCNELGADPADADRRVDKAHPDLPIRRLTRTLDKVDYVDACVLPTGVDGSQVDDLWSSDPFGNDSQITANAEFMQSFLMDPRVDAKASSLSDGGSGAGADVIYISSHGFQTGSMVAEDPNGHFKPTIFDVGMAAEQGQVFAHPGWVLLSNCRTLAAATHHSWLKVMSGPKPLRGITGFREACPLEAGSLRLFRQFIKNLATDAPIVKAWADAMTAFGMADNWQVMCHDDAVGDTMSQWNADKLKPIKSGGKVWLFSKEHPHPKKGFEVVANTDPFRVFWFKDGDPVTPSNRDESAKKLAVGESAKIAVVVPAPAATFDVGTVVDITLIYIREDYNQKIDIGKMFTVTPVGSGTGTPKLIKKNNRSPAGGGPDTWSVKALGDKFVNIEVTLKDLMGMKSGSLLYVRVSMDKPSKITHDFPMFGGILLR